MVAIAVWAEKTVKVKPITNMPRYKRVNSRKAVFDNFKVIFFLLFSEHLHIILQ